MSDFNNLVKTIDEVHAVLHSQAVSAVNKSLTIRNWIIGFYIVEYEQNGDDRANYGDKLFDSLVEKLKHLKGVDKRSLFRFRQFYLVYNYLGNEIKKIFNDGLIIENQLDTIVGSLTPQLYLKVGSATPQIENQLMIPAKKLLSKLSYTHIEQLLPIDEPLKRTFYELECIKGTWSVKELKRQISSLYYERSGMSTKPELLSKLTQEKTKPESPADIIKNIYSFEFLNLPIHSLVEESDLEVALLDNIQQFILELGHGFCLESRQKRILIGDTYYFIDLVFYHRLLRCHVLIDLKIGTFDHGDIGQLNTYVNYYKKEITEADDNAPIGLLLVAEKDHALVEYATAGMDENLFIQKYLVKLPDPNHLKQIIEKEIKNHL